MVEHPVLVHRDLGRRQDVQVAVVQQPPDDVDLEDRVVDLLEVGVRGALVDDSLDLEQAPVGDDVLVGAPVPPAEREEGDADQDERREMWVNSVQIRSGALSAAELESLGAPTSGGIPIVLANVVVPPAVSVGADSAGNVIITFTGTLEASPGLGQAFVPVSGATSPYTINKGDLKSLQLYRSSN